MIVLIVAIFCISVLTLAVVGCVGWIGLIFESRLSPDTATFDESPAPTHGVWSVTERFETKPPVTPPPAPKPASEPPDAATGQPERKLTWQDVRTICARAMAKPLDYHAAPTKVEFRDDLNAMAAESKRRQADLLMRDLFLFSDAIERAKADIPAKAKRCKPRKRTKKR